MKQNRRNSLRKIMLVMLMACLSITALQVEAEDSLVEGSIAEVTVIPSYRHPVSGVVADSGGEASYTTGQGMVEGAVKNSGTIEQLEEGSYYLTITMSLMDFSSNHTFSVQESLESPWTRVEPEVVGTGSDSNGTTQDFRIAMLEASSILRCEMYVEPMGRTVIFFITTGEYQIEEPTDEDLETTSQQGKVEDSDNETVGLVLSTENLVAEDIQVEPSGNHDVNINQILYIVITILGCAILGVLIWNAKINREKKQQKQLWETDDETEK